MLTKVKKKDSHHWQLWIDIIAMMLGIATAILGAFLFTHLDTAIQWLPIMFLMACIVNIITSLKAFYYGRKAAGCGALLTAIVIFGFALVSYITCWT
jgi:hypothetical protein